MIVLQRDQLSLTAPNGKLTSLGLKTPLDNPYKNTPYYDDYQRYYNIGRKFAAA